MSVPVIALALDGFGDAVFESFRGWQSRASAVDCTLLSLGDRPVEALVAELARALVRVTQTGGGSRRGAPRVQLAALFDAEANGAPRAARLATLTSELLRDKFAALFDPRDSPDQRNAALHLVARVPPLGSTDATERSLRELAAVERWAPPAGGYPILARIWPISLQTTLRSIAESGLFTTVAVWLAALIASDEVEALELRFRHPPRPNTRVSMFASATLSIPEAALSTYVVRRARYDALSRIAARVSRPADPGRAQALVSSFPLADWQRAVQGGDAADELRRLAAAQAGLNPAEQARIDVRPFDSPSEIRRRNAALLAPVTPAPITAMRDDVRLHHGLARLTADESEALAGVVEPYLDRVVGEQLAPEDGLRRLPELREALQLARGELIDAAPGGVLGGPTARGQAADADPQRAAVEEALERAPSVARRVLAAWLVAVACGVLAAALTAAVVPPAANYTIPVGVSSAIPSVLPANPLAAPPAPYSDAWSPYWPWIAGTLAALCAGLAYAYWLAEQAVRPLREALRARQAALAELRAAGGAGPTKQLIDREIGVRARRLLRGIIHGIDLRMRRLDAIIALINQVRDQAAQELRALQIGVAHDAADDDISRLFPPSEQLHGHLVTPRLLARWAAHQRSIADPDNWATRFVTETWDVASSDGPCVNFARVESACLAQVENVWNKPVLADETLATEAASRVEAFAPQVAHALGPPIKPRSKTDDVLPTHEVARVAFIPASNGDRVRATLERLGGDFTPREMDGFGARLALICFWEEFSIANLAYAARVSHAADGLEAPAGVAREEGP